MQMRFFVDAWQIIEYPPQVFFCIIIFSSYNHAKTIIAVLISKLLSSFNKLSKMPCHIQPVHRKKYGNE